MSAQPSIPAYDPQQLERDEQTRWTEDQAFKVSEAPDQA